MSQNIRSKAEDTLKDVEEVNLVIVGQDVKGQRGEASRPMPL